MNGTEDPWCSRPPPLAIDIIKGLDTLWIVLYAGLTLMALLSVLLYLEECVYFFQKLPYPKKTAIIWVNGAAPVIATMSCLAMWIPKATMFTDLTSNSYFAIVVYQFLVMMIEECGGDEAFLRRYSQNKLRISTGPCCCCCPCLPHVGISRRTLFILKLGSYQFALLKTVLSILSIVLYANHNFDPWNTNITGASIWIGPFTGILTIIALWPVSIIFIHLRDTLRDLKIVSKFAMYQMVLILSQLQTAIINILAMNHVIPCSPPFSSQYRGYLMNQQLLIAEMFLITLVTRLLYRREYRPLPAAPHAGENGETSIILQTELTDVTA
ncbi:organic solute transporter subunit alpha-like isoform X1 [Paramormyrops kingsleyae]|uniref:Solute carrier family 51 member A n=2 Tax=Paramormyrops kingsleyae TaxID=1676925 RepID=A0A3B3QX84_9TELE|nr:organic solute transporter subunit alpha-like isoform X1 [Paramormyrops kingsleyae]